MGHVENHLDVDINSLIHSSANMSCDDCNTHDTIGMEPTRSSHSFTHPFGDIAPRTHTSNEQYDVNKPAHSSEEVRSVILSEWGREELLVCDVIE